MLVSLSASVEVSSNIVVSSDISIPLQKQVEVFNHLTSSVVVRDVITETVDVVTTIQAEVE